MGLAVVASKMLDHPTSDLGASISKFDHPSEITISGVSKIIVSNLEIWLFLVLIYYLGRIPAAKVLKVADVSA